MLTYTPMNKNVNFVCVLLSTRVLAHTGWSAGVHTNRVDGRICLVGQHISYHLGKQINWDRAAMCMFKGRVWFHT